MFSFFDFRKETLVGTKSIYTFCYRNYIGSGAFSNVYKGVDSNNNTVAIKIQGALGRTEYNILSKLHHPNIVKVLDGFKCKNRYYIILEYVDGVTLSRQHAKNLSSYCRQIVSALVYLKKHGIYHGDIKPSNIMVDKHDCVKLIDFNVCVREKDIDTRSPGTNFFKAPELLFLSYTSTSDLWSLGVTCGMILNIWNTNCLTFRQLQKINCLSGDCKDFLNSLLQINPKKRISWDSIQAHPFILPTCFKNPKSCHFIKYICKHSPFFTLTIPLSHNPYNDTNT